MGAWLSTFWLRFSPAVRARAWAVVGSAVVVAGLLAFPALLWVFLGLLVACFVGGIVSAAVEILRERREARRAASCWCWDNYVCTACTPEAFPPASVGRRSL